MTADAVSVGLRAGSSAIIGNVWSLPIGGFNALGANVVPLTFGGIDLACTGWPGTITVAPA
jgi:hypothetical protein